MRGSLKKSSGFTLIEIIVAFVIFTLLTVLGFRGVTFILDYVERDEAYYQDQDRIQRAWSIVLQDMLHMRPRTERDRLGTVSRAYATDIENYLLVMTRGGMPSITGTESTLQRVAYSLSEEGEFLRWTWPGIDLFDDVEPVSQLLIGGVNTIEFWQLNEANEYEQGWPPLNQQVALDQLPRMVRLVIEMQDGARIERLIPGIESPRSVNQQNNQGGQGNQGNGPANGDEGLDASDGGATGADPSQDDGQSDGQLDEGAEQ